MHPLSNSSTICVTPEILTTGYRMHDFSIAGNLNATTSTPGTRVSPLPSAPPSPYGHSLNPVSPRAFSSSRLASESAAQTHASSAPVHAIIPLTAISQPEGS